MKFLPAALLAASVLALSGATAAAQSPTKWIEVRPAGDGFRIEFPGMPTITRDTVPSAIGPAPRDSAVLAYKGSEYSVELITYGAPSPPEYALDIYVSAIAKDAKLRSQTRLKVGPDAARRLVIEMEDGKVILSVLAVTDGTRFYDVLCLSPRGEETSVSVERFIDSFRLTPP